MEQTIDISNNKKPNKKSQGKKTVVITVFRHI